MNECPCGKALGRDQKKFCGRSCANRSARRGQLVWEETIATALEQDGWEIIPPTACCDRIGIKDGRVFFLEFKPVGNVSLRSGQQSVKDSAPHMYRVVVGTPTGAVAAITGLGAEETAQRKQRPFATSRFPGVSWSKERDKWRSSHTVKGVRTNLGYFVREEDAALAYREEVKRKLGMRLHERNVVLCPEGPTTPIVEPSIIDASC